MHKTQHFVERDSILVTPGHLDSFKSCVLVSESQAIVLTVHNAIIVSLNDQSQKRIDYPEKFKIEHSFNVKMDVPHMFAVTRDLFFGHLADFRYEKIEQRLAIVEKLELSHVKYRDQINSLL